MGQKIQAGEAYVQLTADDAGFRQSLKRASDSLSDLGAKMFATGKIIAAAGAAMLAPFVAAMTKFTKMGSALTKLSDTTGISSRALAELSYALDETGEKTASLKSGLTSMSQFLDQAALHSQSARKELSRLGLSFAELHAMGPEDQFSAIARKIGDIADPARQTAAAMAIFGSQGDDLLPLIKNLDKLRAEAVASGLVPTKEAIESAEAVAGAMRAVTKATKALTFEIAAAFAAVSKGSLQTTKGVIQGVTDWVKKNQALVAQVASVARVVAIAGAVISAIGATFFAASTACGVLAGSITAVGAVLSALVSPFAIVTAAVVGGIAAWAMYTESGRKTVEALTEFFGDLFSIAKETIGGITNALTAGDLELAGKIAVTGLKLIFVTGMASISRAIGGVWGDTIASMTADIAQGDLQGAWDTAVLAMSAIWDDFCAGIFKAFSSAAKAVVNVWESTLKKIAKTMSANDWFMKHIVGVDVAAQREQQEKQNAKARAMGLPENHFDTDGAIDDAVGKMGDDLRGSIDKTMQDRIAGREKAAVESHRDLADHVQDGSPELNAELAELKKQLAGLNKEADVKAKAAAKDADDANDKRKGAGEGTADSIAGTFSAAALSTMGGSNDYQQQQLDETKNIGKGIAENNKKLVNLQKTLERMGAIR